MTTYMQNGIQYVLNHLTSEVLTLEENNRRVSLAMKTVKR